MSEFKRPFPYKSGKENEAEKEPCYPPYVGDGEVEGIYASGAVSACDCTGLTATLPHGEQSAESLRELRDIPLSPEYHDDKLNDYTDNFRNPCR